MACIIPMQANSILSVGGRGQFLFFFFRQNPKHFDAHFALMR
jgi:hypothetical protein